MPKRVGVFVLCIVFAAAALPWVVQSIATRPLIPADFEDQRVQYEATITTSRGDVRATERAGESTLEIRTIGPVATSEPLDSQGATDTIPGPGEALTTVPSKVEIRPATDPDPAATPASGASQVRSTPTFVWIQSVDRITEQMLAQQISNDAKDESITDLSIAITSTGVSASGNISVGFGLVKRFEAGGTFVVSEKSLRAMITSFVVDDQDMTDKQAVPMQERINSSLYRLLSQRYVDSYTLEAGAVTVYSRMMP